MVNKPCPFCTEKFNRGHIINKYPFNYYITEKDKQQFKRDKEKYKNSLPKNYNILNSLLNH